MRRKNKGFAVAVATVAVAGTIAAPALANETAVTPEEQAAQAQQNVEQAAQAVANAKASLDKGRKQP